LQSRTTRLQRSPQQKFSWKQAFTPPEIYQFIELLTGAGGCPNRGLIKVPVRDALVARNGQDGGIVVKNSPAIAAECRRRQKMADPLTRPLPVSEKLLT
jgi:hypothetical protein